MILYFLPVLKLFLSLTGNGVSANVVVPLHLALDRKILKSVEGSALPADVVEGFYVTVDLGTPPQRMHFFVDTGSSDLVVASYPAPNLSSYFNWTKSTSYVSEQETLSTHYVEGFYNGTVGSDVLTLPAASFSFRTTVIAMSYSKGIFPLEAQWHGILGLSYPSLTKYTTFLQSLDLQSDAGHFTLEPCRKTLAPSGEPCGTLVFGGPMPANMFFAPVIQAQFYSISLVNLAVGNATWPGSCKELNGEQTIVDTGTSDLKFPQPVYKWLIRILSELGYNLMVDASTVYCLEDGFTTSAFPILYLHILGTKNRVFTLEIPPEVYFQRVMVTSLDHPCHRLGIGPSESGAVLGFTVLRRLVTTFVPRSDYVGFREVPADGASRVTISAANYTYSGQDCPQRHVPSKNSTWKIFQYVLAFICAMCAIPALVIAFLCLRRRIRIYKARNKTDVVNLVEF